MASHGVVRTKQYRTAEQHAQDQVRIEKYRSLEDTIRAQVRDRNYGGATFELSTRLLRANPEYYTIWNVRRRCLTSGIFSASSGGRSPSRASPNSTAAPTGTPSSADCSTSSSIKTPRPPPCPKTSRSGTIASEGAAGGPALSGELDASDTAAVTAAEEEEEEEKRKAAEQQENDVEVVRAELMFTVPLLMEFPKCYWIWNHRLWILNQAIALFPVPVARQIWEQELGLTSKMLHKDKRNFHAWGYRRQVVRQLEDPALAGQSMVESEFKYTRSMIEGDLSNFSAWHNRSQLIPRLLDERGADPAARTKLLEDELSLIQDAVNVGPEDQSLWYYHQFLILNIVSSDAKTSFVPHLSAAERLAYIDTEIENIKDLLEDYLDIKWIYEALLECTLAKAKVENGDAGTSAVADDAKEDFRGWLGKLKELDPTRRGRWVDVEETCGLV